MKKFSCPTEQEKAAQNVANYIVRMIDDPGGTWVNELKERLLELVNAKVEK